MESCHRPGQQEVSVSERLMSLKRGGIRIESLAVGCLSGSALNMGILPLIGDAMLAVLALIA